MNSSRKEREVEKEKGNKDGKKIKISRLFMSTLSSFTCKSSPLFFLNHYIQHLTETRKKTFTHFSRKRLPLVHTTALKIFVYFLLLNYFSMRFVNQ